MSHNYTDLSRFLQFVFEGVGADERVCLTLKHADNTWTNYPAGARRIAAVERTPGAWYFGVCTAAPPTEDGGFTRARENMRRAYCLVLDDVGTKAAEPPVAPAWRLQSSEGNWQYGYLIEPLDVTVPENESYYEACQRGLADAGYTDAGACGTYRVMRVPGSLHRTGYAATVEYGEGEVWPLEELMRALGVAPAARRLRERREAAGGGLALDDVDDPVYGWLVDAGMTTGNASSKFVEVLCPWRDEHTSGGDVAGYTPVGYDPRYPQGAFSCLHEHCKGRGRRELLAWVAEQGGPGDAPNAAPPAGALDASGLPDLRVTKDGRPAAAQPATAANVGWVIDQIGARCELDVMAMARRINRAERQSGGRAAIRSALLLCGISNETQLLDVLEARCDAHPYHPAEEWLESLPAWDGVDRVEALAASVDVAPGFEVLWRTYLRRWLAQCVVAASNWRRAEPEQLSGVLVLAGDQGIGKSTWLSSLVPPSLFAGGVELHLSTAGAKDQQIKGLERWIVELGELDSTFRRSDVAALKNFLSTTHDSIRPPYAREPIRRHRCTAFAASVNSMDFLSDLTGNRRFWPVEVARIRAHGLDTAQLWAQLREVVAADPTAHVLTEAEAEQQRESADAFRGVTDIEEAFLGYFDAPGVRKLPEEEWRPRNLTGICALLRLDEGVMRTPVRRAELRELVRQRFGAPHMIDGQQKVYRVPVLMSSVEAIKPRTT